MEGLYVDTQHCLRIVTPEWIVYTAGKEADGWVGTARPTTPASKHWITLETPTKEHRGIFDGESCISWDDGDKWHRLVVTYAQWDLLTHRRFYVPMTMVVVAYVVRAVRWAVSKVSAT